MTTPNEDERKDLARDFLICIQVLKWDPPKEFFRRKAYEDYFARKLADKLASFGWEFTKVPKSVWTGLPLA